MHIEPLSAHIGAEVRGIDLVTLTDAGAVAQLRAALLEHLVLFFRDQHFEPASMLACARRFGDLSIYPFVAGMPDYPEIVEVLKHENERVNFGGLWHSDTTYLERPPLGSLLYAKTLPTVGGDTLFASMYAAYDALSDGLKASLRGLRALNSAGKADAAATRTARIEDHGRAVSETTEAYHPVVRTHPETGRRALYVNGGHTVCFEGMTAQESAPLLGLLYSVQQRPEFSCRFRWQPGSVALWDNRAAQHNAINDYHGQRRVMWRITLAGDTPR